MSVSCWPQAAAAQQGNAEAVTLSGASNSAFSFGSDASAFFIANNDGTFDQKDNAAASIQINSATDWIIPNSAAPGAYRIRHTSAVGDTGASFWFPATTINTYIALTNNRQYEVRDTTPGAQVKTVTFTLEIDDGSVSQDTGSYTLTAEREDF